MKRSGSSAASGLKSEATLAWNTSLEMNSYSATSRLVVMEFTSFASWACMRVVSVPSALSL